MTAEWKTLCSANDIKVEGVDATVTFHDGRSHRVTVTETTDEYRLHAVVARRAIAAGIGRNLPVDVWMRNRVVSLVGFRQDARGRVICEAYVPKAGLSQTEFQFYVRTLAIESDRYEYALTGLDVE